MKKGVFLIGLFLLIGFVKAVENKTQLSAKVDSTIASLSFLSDSVLTDTIIRISRQSSIDNDRYLAHEYARWALKNSKNKLYKDLIPKARFYFARSIGDIGKTDSAIINYRICLEELKGTKVAYWRKFVYTNITYLYQRRGEFEKALNTQLDALEILEGEIDTVRLSQIYTDIGYSYDRMKEFQKAIEWHDKALDLLGNRDDYIRYFIMGRKAIAYDDLEQFDSALYYNFQALRYSISIDDSTEIGIISSNIGNTYLKQKRWQEARKYLQNATQLVEKFGDDGNKAIAFINLGNVLFNLNEFLEAEKAIRKGINYASRWNGTKFQSEGYYLLYQLYEKQGQLDSSLNYYKRHNLLEDSIYNISKINQIAELTTKYETEKKEQQLEIQELTLVEQSVQLKKRQQLIFSLSILLILVIGIGWLLYRQYKIKKEKQLQKVVIYEQERGIQAVISAQESERKRISKDLHDGVGQQLSGLKMAFQKVSKGIEKENPERSGELMELSSILSESADEVRYISHQMMPKALTELGLIEALEDMLKKSFDYSDMKYEFDHYGIKSRLEENIEISLYRIAQELVNNVIKHSNANNVSVQLFKNQQKVILIVEDDGKGVSSDKIDGHGILNIRSRANSLGGEANLEPSPNGGFLATIRITV